MNRSLAIASTMLVALSGTASAAPCDGTALSQAAATAQLQGKRIFAETPDASEDWKEDHCASGAVYKVGPGGSDPVDPRTQVATYSIDGSGNVTYTYTSSSHSFVLKEDAGTFWYCNGTAQVARIISNAAMPGGLDCSNSL